MFEPTTDLMIEAAQTIEKGAATIEEVGWTQGKLCDHQTGALCLFGGLQVAMGMGTSEGAHSGWTGPRSTPLRRAITQAMLDEVYPDAMFDADLGAQAEHLSSYWNDREATTKDIVIDAMRRAASALYKKAGVG